MNSPFIAPTEPHIPKPTANFEVIDFDRAVTLLSLNEPHKVGVKGTNRKIRDPHVVRLAKEMLAGEWIETDQGIGISVENKLINGQHRLEALILAAETNPNITITSLVVWNLPIKAKLAIDIGAVRRTGDFMAFEGVGNGNKIGAALKLLYCYDEIPYDYTIWSRYAVSPTRLVELLDTYSNIEDAYHMGRGVMRVTSPSSITAAMAILLRDRPDVIEHLPRFMEPLKTGANLGTGSPILALRTWCLNAATSKKHTNGVILLALIIRSLNHWIEDTRAKHLVFRKEDLFPTLTKKEFYPR
jgi:hypothetical protein